ncbi:MAG: transposase [Parcubacteria group bacterium]|jgi:REP element-mobilizing transposase RayT|nr:transposase [Parcubacteria group bacterium]|tara:strand:+ start:11339 stop:11842 length:504 start_codon:yes stop_codon:yes gene_type:complete
MIKERKLNRYSNYNYNLPGYYFITICVQDRIKYFGKIGDGRMILNKYGKIAIKYLMKIPNFYTNVAIDEFVIIPNHIHIIIEIKSVGTEQCSVPTGVKNINYGLLSKVVKSFKDVTTKEIHGALNDYHFQWQRSFYDHIIRDENGLYNIRQYIINNPSQWNRDRNNV